MQAVSVSTAVQPPKSKASCHLSVDTLWTTTPVVKQSAALPLGLAHAHQQFQLPEVFVQYEQHRQSVDKVALEHEAIGNLLHRMFIKNLIDETYLLHLIEALRNRHFSTDLFGDIATQLNLAITVSEGRRCGYRDDDVLVSLKLAACHPAAQRLDVLVKQLNNDLVQYGHSCSTNNVLDVYLSDETYSESGMFMGLAAADSLCLSHIDVQGLPDPLQTIVGKIAYHGLGDFFSHFVDRGWSNDFYLEFESHGSFDALCQKLHALPDELFFLDDADEPLSCIASVKACFDKQMWNEVLEYFAQFYGFNDTYCDIHCDSVSASYEGIGNLFHDIYRTVIFHAYARRFESDEAVTPASVKATLTEIVGQIPSTYQPLCDELYDIMHTYTQLKRPVESDFDFTELAEDGVSLFNHFILLVEDNLVGDFALEEINSIHNHIAETSECGLIQIELDNPMFTAHLYNFLLSVQLLTKLSQTLNSWSEK